MRVTDLIEKYKLSFDNLEFDIPPSVYDGTVQTNKGVWTKIRHGEFVFENDEVIVGVDASVSRLESSVAYSVMYKKVRDKKSRIINLTYKHGHINSLSFEFYSEEENDYRTIAVNIYSTEADIVRTYLLLKNGKYHSLTSPAKMEFFIDGTCSTEEWYQDGLVHRAGELPAVIVYGANGKASYSANYKYDIYHQLSYDTNSELGGEGLEILALNGKSVDGILFVSFLNNRNRKDENYVI